MYKRWYFHFLLPSTQHPVHSLLSLCEFCLSVGFFSAKLFSLKWLLCSESSKAAIWLLIGMLKYLLSTLKPPLHITLVVLLSSFAICLCVVLYFWHKYRGWQASKGRKRREPTPTELTFKLHPIPPGSKGTALNVRLNSEICMKKICFLLLSKGFKGTMKLHQSATSFFCPYVYQLGRTWMQRPSDFSFIASDDGCKSIYSVCLSLLSSCMCCADRWASVLKRPVSQQPTWCLMYELNCIWI